MKRLLILLTALSLTLGLCACGSAADVLDVTSTAEVILEDASVPPSFVIYDVDDSSQIAMTLDAVYTEWYYNEDGETVSIESGNTSASGDADEAILYASYASLLTLTMNYDTEIYYTVDTGATPDRMVQTSWKSEYIGDESADAMEVYTMLENFDSLPLKTDRVYQITVIWSEENYESRGYYGTLTYMFMTQ